MVLFVSFRPLCHEIKETMYDFVIGVKFDKFKCAELENV